MADQAQRLEAATVKAENGSDILSRFSNDAVEAPPILTESGPIPNLKQVIASIHGEGAVISAYNNSSTLASGESAVLTVAQTTKPMLLYKLSTAITQVATNNLDVTLTVGSNVIYRAESLAKSIDSTFPVFTDHFGAITLTLANKSANSCDVSVNVIWSEL